MLALQQHCILGHILRLMFITGQNELREPIVVVKTLGISLDDLRPFTSVPICIAMERLFALVSRLNLVGHHRLVT